MSVLTCGRQTSLPHTVQCSPRSPAPSPLPPLQQDKETACTEAGAKPNAWRAGCPEACKVFWQVSHAPALGLVGDQLCNGPLCVPLPHAAPQHVRRAPLPGHPSLPCRRTALPQECKDIVDDLGILSAPKDASGKEQKARWAGGARGRCRLRCCTST